MTKSGVVQRQQAPRRSSKANAGSNDGSVKWQEEKSQIMRESVMEATMACFVKFGFSNTTVEKIAKEARVSRGALMHHFSSRDDVIRTSIGYIVSKRAEECEKHIDVLQAKSLNRVVSEESVANTLAEFWSYFHTPSFSAMLELLMASRGHSDLDEVLAPALEKLDLRTKDAIRNAFPAWHDLEETRQVVTDLVFYALQGLALSKATRRDEPRVQKLFDLITREVVREYRRGAGQARKAARR